MQSGGNAIPLGKRKFSSQETSPDDTDSDTDSDAPLPGEADSDASELDSGSDTSQMQLPTDGFDDVSMSEGSSLSQGSDSEEDTPLAPEQQPAASRRKPAAAVKSGQQLQQQSRAQAAEAGENTSVDESDDGEEEPAAINASRRTSHQVLHSRGYLTNKAVLVSFALLPVANKDMLGVFAKQP